MEKYPSLETMGLEQLLQVYKGKKVLVTGHTGFKGSWLCLWLNHIGAEIIGIGLDTKTSRDNFVCSRVKDLLKSDYRVDIRDQKKVQEIFDQEQPEVVFHLAAQPIVLDSYEQPVYTFDTNIMGTVHVLEACRNTASVTTGVFITTDKCYDNKEWVFPYRESDPMGGYDPYSSSKGAAELVISSYRNSFLKKQGKKIASARAGNVIGGGDWAPYRIMVDLVSAIEKDKILEVRSPKAIRPWQHVLEPLSGYLILGARLLNSEEKAYDQAWNFGPESSSVHTVEQLVETTIQCFGTGQWQDASEGNYQHEAKLLALDISKARLVLGWYPALSFKETVEYTVEWYKNYEHADMRQLCYTQIKNYCTQWNSKNAS